MIGVAGDPVAIVTVAAGAALGAATRHALALLGRGWSATLIANVAGSFALGFLNGLNPAHLVWLGMGVGFCGALTTMSSLMLEAHDRGPLAGAGLIASHCALGLPAAAIGMALGVLT